MGFCPPPVLIPNLRPCTQKVRESQKMKEKERHRRCKRGGEGESSPDWMISFAHSLQGNRATYIVQPFTSAEFLFMIAFISAWHTVHTHTLVKIINTINIPNNKLIEINKSN